MSINSAWKITFGALIIAAIFVVWLPIIIMEPEIITPSYIWDLSVPIPAWFFMTSIFWIPVGLWASRLFHKGNRNRATRFVAIMFFVINVLLI